MLRKNILVICFLFISAFSMAQTAGRYESKEIFLPINYVYRVNDTVITFSYSAKTLGVEKGLFAKAYKISISAIPGERPAIDFHQAGSGRMVKLDTTLAGLIKLYQEKDTLAAGDLISVTVNIPALPYRSIFSELAFKNIIFKNLNKELIFSLQDLINADSHKKEDSIFSAVVTDVHNAWQKIKDRTDIPQSLFEKANAGRFKGKATMEVLRDATQKDIEAFLLYVKTKPAGYMGKNFSVSESFAGWLVSNSPYSYTEIKEALFPIYKNKLQFEKLLPVYKEDIIKEAAIESLGEEAISLSENKKYAEAQQLIEFALVLADAVKDTSAKAVTYLIKGQIYQNQEKYTEALIECDNAIKFAIESNNKDIELQALSKKVYCLYKASKFNEALIIQQLEAKKINDYRSAIGETNYKNKLQHNYEVKGNIYYMSGDYKQALEAYAVAIDLNNEINNYETRIKNAELYTFLGRVNNDQGKPNEALEYFTKAAKIYRQNFDSLNWALLQNEIAYSYYNLSNYRKSILYSDSALSKLLSFSNYDNAGYSKSLMGSNYWQLGQYDSAVTAHKESIALRKKGNNISGQAFSWKQIGELYLLSGLKNLALIAYDSAATLYQKIKDNAGLAETYNKKGTIYLNDENYKKAVDLFEKANGITSKATVEALYNLGNAWAEIDTAKARYYYSLCRQKSDSTGNTGYVFDATRALAGLAYRSHNIEAGNKLYNESLKISSQLNTALSYASCLALKAQGFYNETKLDSALLYYKKALNIYDTVSKEQTVWQLNNISGVQVALGDFAEAENTLIRAIKIAQANSNNIVLGYSLQASSFLYGLTGDFEKGIKNNDSAIAIFQKSGNILRLVDTYISRGTLLKSMGSYKQSINAFLLSDSLTKEEQVTENRHVILNNIGVTYYNQADYQNALKYFEQALKLLPKDVIDETYLLYKANKAECLFYLKKPGEAEAILLEILPLARQKKLSRVSSQMALVLGKIYYEDKQLSKANSYFKYAADFAVASGEKEKIIDAFTYLGKVNIQSEKKDSAEINFRKAIDVVTKYKIAGGWEPFYEIGVLFYNNKKFDSSITYFKTAIDLLDKNAENLYGGDEAKKIFNNDPRKSDLYNKITFAYYNIGNEKEAFAFANKSMIAGIKEFSGALAEGANDKEKNEVLKKLAMLQQSKKALETTAGKQTGEAKEQILKKIEILEADYTNFLQDVVEKYPDLNPYFTKSNADEFYNYKGKLPNDVAVVLYLVNDKTLMIFTLTNEKLAVDTMTVDISNTISAFISATKRPEKGTGTGALHLRTEPVDEDETITNIPFKDLSGKLYNTLIATVYDRIKNKKKLCIIPTGIFSNMPFQCLGQKTGDSSFRFLIEDYSIFYTNKMKIFEKENNPVPDKKDLFSFAAFGVPDKSLRYNTTEVKEIGKIMGIDSTIYADGRATESQAKLSLIQKKYIHFATHGVLNYSKEFSQSYLKFLPDKDTSNGNNGQLTIREIQRLAIVDCNLVILSACETAINKELVKGWNISPANSFLERKVKSVIASLWKVDDQATSILMDEFYFNLNKKMEKVDALRLAQEKLSKNPLYSHPFYWGAFVLYGDWR